MCAFSVNSNLSTEETDKVHALLKEFEKTFGENVDSKRLNPNVFPMFRFHHIFVGVDASNIYLVYTTEGFSSPVFALIIRN